MSVDHLVTAGGVHTHFTESGSGEPVVVLHGFSGSTETMQPLADHLAARHRVISIDLIGHGLSEKPDDPTSYSMDAAVKQVLGVLGARVETPAAIVGYSMGARIGLATALSSPESIRSLVMIGGTAGIADPGQRADRVRADEELAAGIEANGVEWFADVWMRQPFFAGQRRLGPSHMEAARKQRAANAPHALAHVLRGLGTGAQPSLWHLVPGLRVPLLCVVGHDDPKFVAIGEQLVAAAPDALLVVVPGAGHAAHLESPADGYAAIDYFLAKPARPFD